MTKMSSDLDHIFENVVGGNSKWQWFTVFMLWPIAFASAFPWLLHLFTSYEVKHRCFVPSCDSPEQSHYVANFTKFALPLTTQETKEGELFLQAGKFDDCQMLAPMPGDETCDENSFSNVSVNCETFVYDRTIFEETLTSQFNLICEQDGKRRFLSTIMLLGLIIGSLCGGYICDKYGRKNTMLVSVIIILPNVFLGGFSPNYETYCVLRLLTCMVIPSIWIGVHSMTLEVFDRFGRKTIALVKDFLWPVSHSVLTLIVYHVRNWTHIHFWVAGISCLALPCFYFLSESPRWLASNKRTKQAEKVLLDAAKMNGKTLSEENLRDIQNVLRRIDAEATSTVETKFNLTYMFGPKSLKTTVVLLFNWITLTFGNFTLLLSATKLHGDLFANYLMASILGDVPGTLVLLVTMKYFSRRVNILACQTLVFICCLIMAFLPKEHTTVIMILYLTGKCSAGSGILLAWVMTAELYPTNLRSQACGVCSTIAKTISLLCPYVGKLNVFWAPLPMLILSVPSVIAGFCAYTFLPETKNKQLPQSIKENVELEEL